MEGNSRSWMYGDRTAKEYAKGIHEFCLVAEEHRRLNGATTILCPRRDCNNNRRCENIHTIAHHLFRRGFKPDYKNWYWHGEKMILDPDDESAWTSHVANVNFTENGGGGDNDEANSGKDLMHEMIDNIKNDAQESSCGSNVASSTALRSADNQAELRPLTWRLAHERRQPGGTYAMDSQKSLTVEIIQKIRTLLETQANMKESRTLTIRKRGRDALTYDFGKPGHCGRAKGVGNLNVTVRPVLGRNDRHELSSQLSDDSTMISGKEEIRKVKEEIKEEIRKEIN